MNNLSYFEMIKDINNLLSKYNKDEVITAIIKEYTKDSVQNCQALLDFIPKIAKYSMSILEKENSKKDTALYMLMIQNDIKIEGNERAYFATMIPVCLTYFPKVAAKQKKNISICSVNFSKTRKHSLGKGIKIGQIDLDIVNILDL